MKFYLTVGKVALPIVSPAEREIPDTCFYGCLTTIWYSIEKNYYINYSNEPRRTLFSGMIKTV